MGIVINKEEAEKIRKIPMLFILGKGRSGTTLLESMLNSHPNIVAPPESKFMMLLYPRFIGIRKWSEKDVQEFIELAYQDPLFNRVWQIDKTQLTAYLISIKDHLDYALVCKTVYYFMKGDKENIVWISDKNPIYCLFISRIQMLFPEAKFIHMMRDPRDNILSHIVTFSVKNTYFKAQQWLRYNMLIEKTKNRIGDKFFTLSYESLVENPEAVLIPLCKFLNVTYTPEMLKREMPEKISRNNDIKNLMEKTHKNLYTPIQTSAIGKWKTEMRPEDMAITSIIAQRYAHEKYGYVFNETDWKDVKVSHFKIMRWKYIYFIWQAFTRTRYSSLRLNFLYSGIKRRMKGEKLHPWDYF